MFLLFYFIANNQFNEVMETKAYVKRLLISLGNWKFSFCASVKQAGKELIKSSFTLTPELKGFLFSYGYNK